MTFFDCVEVGTDEECWTWTGTRHSEGYGRFRVAPYTRTQAHRVAYQLHHGPLSSSQELHHVCENKLCCNPHHLQAVGVGEHVKLHNPRQVYCQRGHLQEGENVYHRKDRPGERQCRICTTERKRELRSQAT